jgi:hypothetical protein
MNPNHKTYKFRAAWIAAQFGKPAKEHELLMEDGKTALMIWEFPPQTHNGRKCEHWIYTTNGMAERQMPWITGPKGNPKKRIELMIYTAEKSAVAIELLHALAKFPFAGRTGLDRYQTMPFSHPQLDWSGLLLMEPPCMEKDSDAQSIYPEKTEDITFLLQVVGLKNTELDHAVAEGGKKFIEETFDRVKNHKNLWPMLLFDLPRPQFPLRKKA